MPTKIRKGGTWQSITACKVFAQGAWRDIVAIKVFSGGTWRLVGNFTAPPPPPSGGGGSGSGGGGGGGGGGGTITLSLSTASIRGIATNSATITSTGVTVTPSGGSAPYSYLWSIVTQDGLATYTINSPTTATTAVTGSGLPSDTTVSCTIHCVVTDSLGTTATSGSVAASFTNQSGA